MRFWALVNISRLYLHYLIHMAAGKSVVAIAAGQGHAAITETHQQLKAQSLELAEPLCTAAGLGLLAEVEALLKAGAPADAVTKGGNTPLAAAAKGGGAEVVQALIAAGASVDKPAGFYHGHKTALDVAVQSNHPAVVRQLLQAGADVRLAGAAWYGTPWWSLPFRRHSSVVGRAAEHAACGQGQCLEVMLRHFSCCVSGPAPVGLEAVLSAAVDTARLQPGLGSCDLALQRGVVLQLVQFAVNQSIATGYGADGHQQRVWQGFRECCQRWCSHRVQALVTGVVLDAWLDADASVAVLLNSEGCAAQQMLIGVAHVVRTAHSTAADAGP